jgi:hypothetical protein
MIVTRVKLRGEIYIKMRDDERQREGQRERQRQRDRQSSKRIRES